MKPFNALLSRFGICLLLVAATAVPGMTNSAEKQAAVWRPIFGAWNISFQDKQRGTVRGYVVITEPGKITGTLFSPGKNEWFQSTGVSFDGATLKGSYFPYFEDASFTLSLGAGGNLLAGQWKVRSADGRTPSREGVRVYDDPKNPLFYNATGAETWTRAVPRIESITVSALENSALDYLKMREIWKITDGGANLPKIALDVKGDNLPLILPTFQEYIRVQFDDPRLIFHVCAQMPKTKTVRLLVWLGKNATPGVKTLTLNGVSATWELKFFNMGRTPPAKTPAAFQLGVHWQKPAGQRPHGWTLEGQSKDIIPIKATPTGQMPLLLDVTEARPSGASLAAANVPVTITVNNRLSGARQFSKTAPVTFDAKGQGVFPLTQTEVMRGCGARVNLNAFEAIVRLTYRNRPLQALSQDLAHVLKQKLILFIPGVFGSRIRVASHPNEEAYPEWSVVGESEFNRLACDRQGEPLSRASRLELFKTFSPATIYDVENRSELREPPGYPKLFCGGKTEDCRVPYFVVKAWPYDWRIKVERHVDSLMGRTHRPEGDPVEPPYVSPPSLREIVKDIKNNYWYRHYVDDKIAIACHSTGGLITRGVLTESGAENYIDRVFYIDVPFWGAPKAYHVYLTGDMGIAFIRDNFIRQLAPNMPIMYYLAPSEQYPDPVTRNLRPGPTHGVDRRSPGQPVSLFMNQLIAGGRQGGEYPAAGSIDPWNSQLEAAANAYHNNLVTRPTRLALSNVKVFWSNSQKNDTIGTLYLTAENEFASLKIAGDGTVPVSSQRADFPAASLVEVETHPEHVPSPNEPFVWRKIVEFLGE